MNDHDFATSKLSIDTVAVVGTGVIGRSWAAVFARAGCRVKLFDQDPKQLQNALDWLEHDLDLDVADGIITREHARTQLDNIAGFERLDEALAGVGYVQENGPEVLDIKRTIYESLGDLSDSNVILASSTSAIDINDIAGHLRCSDRCIVAHPVNPPHVVPVVEVLPGSATTPAVTEATQRFLREIGQTPVKLNFFLPGFLLNRMQAALIREAIHLLKCGVADADAIDAVIRDGLGLRWALMGPFGVANTNHDDGVRGYFTTFRDAYVHAWDDLGPTPSMAPELIAQIGDQTDEMTGNASLPDIRRWRDSLVREIRRIKRESPHPEPAVSQIGDEL